MALQWSPVQWRGASMARTGPMVFLRGSFLLKKWINEKKRISFKFPSSQSCPHFSFGLSRSCMSCIHLAPIFPRHLRCSRHSMLHPSRLKAVRWEGLLDDLPHARASHLSHRRTMFKSEWKAKRWSKSWLRFLPFLDVLQLELRKWFPQRGRTFTSRWPPNCWESEIHRRDFLIKCWGTSRPKKTSEGLQTTSVLFLVSWYFTSFKSFIFFP